MFDDELSSVSSTSSASSPSKRRFRLPPLTRRDPVGIDPDELIGKKLIRISRSSVHPSLTLDFDDHTSAQVLVDGYSPRWKGIPKALEMDEAFQRLTNTVFVGLDTLEIVDCAMIKLCDKAFQRKQNDDHDSTMWDQEHAAIAFKFSGENPHWHCVWAVLAEYDEDRTCTFRSFEDVFLNYLQRSPRKQSRIDKLRN
ncbi:MAG: hypothetical protein NXY57DRAFT_999826 [Lentinula lateritia]|uniref:Ubiquitin-like protease family profile domain-containing protein n=1 Tax=Lentinula lateritia TaxID=40482 RepID=A0ABQ8VP78_9AGAR|nr:MAG: hypothetical protein NXY57DRAFT_999826 [Lentinula lateritia]KAJ4498198.1 hypothetical protein C8R41DRAFT_819628 [Lentinula lateritia]